MHSQQTTAGRILVTGAAKRIGRAIAEALLHRGQQILLHVNRSRSEAEQLQAQWHAIRPGSCEIIEQDLSQPDAAEQMLTSIERRQISISGLVNNASTFNAAPILPKDSLQPPHDPSSIWQNNMQVNFITPAKLIRLLADSHPLQSVVNLIDIYAATGLANHTAYVAAKASLLKLSRALAREFAPQIRINAVSPGAILWPENKTDAMSQTGQQQIIENTALKQLGSAQAIAHTVSFLLLDASYITGQNIRVDGGRRWYI